MTDATWTGKVARGAVGEGEFVMDVIPIGDGLAALLETDALPLFGFHALVRRAKAEITRGDDTAAQATLDQITAVIERRLGVGQEEDR